VNTSEALFVLRRAGGHYAAIERGLRYLSLNLKPHLQERGPRVRYVAYAIFAFCDFRDQIDEGHLQTYVRWLKDARNFDNGWGDTANDGASHLFPTILAVMALSLAGSDDKQLEDSRKYILSLAQDGGWAVRPSEPPSAVANAYALTGLGSWFQTHTAVQIARNSLVQTTHWGYVQEGVPGTLWRHCTYAWALPALAGFLNEPYAPVIAEGIRYINTLTSSNGWSESPGRNDTSVRSQYWAVMALSAVATAFDPAIHSLRIDAERAQIGLNEPDFVKIAIHSRWATVLPSSVYRAMAFAPAIAGLLLLLGVHRNIPPLPHAMDSIIAILLFVVAFLLVQKRRKLFPRFAASTGIVLIMLELLDLLFGIDVRTFLLAAIKFVRGK
jgi:hypothetical protein